MDKTKILSAVAAVVLLSSVSVAHGQRGNHGAHHGEQEAKTHAGRGHGQHAGRGHGQHAGRGHGSTGENNNGGNAGNNNGGNAGNNNGGNAGNNNGGNAGNNNGGNAGNNNDGYTEDSTLSQELVNTLSYMGNEERLAYDVYNALYAQWGTKQFTNIASKSEVKHIQAVQDLIQKYKINDDVTFTNVDLPALGYMNTPVEQMQAGTYDISKIQRLYDDLVSEGSASEVAALQVACKVEVIDVEDLDAYIEIAEASDAADVVDTFNFLRNGSYNHYWAFDGALKNIGVNDGCCSLGTTYCHPEYPTK